jgi:hypothetical protein
MLILTRIILLALFESTILLVITHVLFPNNAISKNPKWKIPLFIASYVFLQTVCVLFLLPLYHSLIILLLIIVLLKTLGKLNIYSSLVAALSFVSLVILTETVLLGLFMLTMNLSMDELIQYLSTDYVLSSATKVFQLAIVLLLTRFKLQLSNKKLFSANESAIVRSITQFVVLAFLIMSFFYKAVKPGYETTYNLIVFMGIAVFIFIAIKDILTRQKLAHVASIKGLHAEEYTTYPLEVDESIDIISYETGDLYIDRLLSLKKNVARDKQILFEVYVFKKITGLTFFNEDLIRILDYLIDHAITQLNNTDQVDKWIKIIIYRENDFLGITISNNGKPISQEQISHLLHQAITPDSSIKALIECNGGKIIADSTTEASRFTVMLPS